MIITTSSVHGIRSVLTRGKIREALANQGVRGNSDRK